jgi:hypothetical protein
MPFDALANGCVKLTGGFPQREDAGENSYSFSKHLAAGVARSLHFGR